MAIRITGDDLKPSRGTLSPLAEAESTDKRMEKAEKIGPIQQELPKVGAPAVSMDAPKRKSISDVISAHGYYMRSPTKKEIEQDEARRNQRLNQGYPVLVDYFFEDRRDAWETSPDEEAYKIWLSERSGIPHYFYDDPVMQKEAQVRAQMNADYAAYNSVSESTLRWMSVNENLRIARDDAVGLDEVRKSWNKMALAVAPSESGSLSRWLMGGMADVFRNRGNKNVMYAEGVDFVEKDPLSKEMRDLVSMGGEYITSYGPPVVKEFDWVRKKKAQLLGALGQWQYGMADRVDPGAYLMPTSTWGRWLHDIARSSPYTISSMGSSLAINSVVNAIVPGLGVYAATLHGAHAEAELQAGNVYVEARRRGYGVQDAYELARGVSGANFGLLLVTEFAQNLLTFGASKGSSGLLSSRVLGSNAYRRAAWVGEKALSAIFEGGEEVMQDVIDAVAFGDELDADGLVWSFSVGFGSGGMYSVGGSMLNRMMSRSSKLVERNVSIDRARAGRKGVEEITGAIAASRTAQRAPEAVVDFIRQATDGEIDTVFIDGAKLGEVFRQLADERSVEAMVEELGIADTYEAAVATGIDVEVEAARLLTLMGTQDRYDAVKDHIRMTADDMTAFEAEMEASAQEAEIVRMLEEYERQGKEVAVAGEVGVALTKRIKDQLVASGRTDLFGKKGRNAEMVAQLMTARVIRKASDLGVSLDELATPGMVRVVRDGADVRILISRGKRALGVEVDKDVYPQKAYNGSPYRFDKFTLDAIGTGEGQQAYGWGLYFSGEKKVAEWYRKKLEGRENAGQVYKVDIPEINELLDYDRELSKQPTAVKRAIRKIVDGLTTEQLADLDGDITLLNNPENTGRDFYNTISSLVGGDKDASLLLAKNGVRGVQYLDGNSRNGGDGSHNFVVFDGDAVSVLETYYQKDDVLSAAKQLAADEAAFSDAVDKVFTGNVRSNVRVMTTPLVFHLAGANLLPVYMSAQKIKKVLEDHPGMRPDLLKQIPRALTEPIAVFESKSSKGARYGGLVAMLELKDAHGATVAVALHLNVGDGRYEVNKLASAYGKDKQSPEGLESRNEWFVDEVKAGRLRYVDTKKAAVWSDEAGLQLLPTGVTKQQLHKKSIATEEDLVKAKKAYAGFYQSDDAVVRGETSFTETESLITLFKAADKSTLLHELGHVFLQDVRDVAAVVDAPEGVRVDWQRLVDWLDVADIDFSGELSEMDAKRWSTAHERFAAGFEQYLAEGRAPIRELAGAFRAFKRWLIAIYRAIRGIRYRDAQTGAMVEFEINDEVRGVFDRMLATDEAIEYEAGMRDLAETADVYEADAVLLGELEGARVEMLEGAKERLLSEALSEVAPDRRAEAERRARKLQGYVRSIVEREPVYKAILEMQANPDIRLSHDEVLDCFGDTTVANLPEGVDAPDGIPVSVAASSFGFESAEAFVDALVAARPIDVEVAKRAMEIAVAESGGLVGERLGERAGEVLVSSEESMDMLVLEAAAMRDPYAEVWGEMERADGERDNPLNRANVVRVLRKQGGLSYEAVVSGYGEVEARDLAQRTGPGIWRKSGVGLDKAAQVLESLGVPVEGDDHLYGILMGREEAVVNPLDEAYEKGFKEAKGKLAEWKERERRRLAEKRADKRGRDKEDRARRGAWTKEKRERAKALKNALRVATEEMMASKPIEEVKSRPYEQAAKRARREAEVALRRKDFAAADVAKDREILNHALARAAMVGSKEYEKMLGFLNRRATRGAKQTFGMTPGTLSQVDAILERFDLRKKVPKEGAQKSLPSLMKFVEELQAAGEPVMIPDFVLDAGSKKHYTQLTLDEFRDVFNAVKNIEHIGKSEKRLISSRYRAEVEGVVRDIVGGMEAYYKFKGPSDMDPSDLRQLKGLFDRLKDAPESFMASLEMTEFLTRAMDGYADLGAAHQYIFQPVRDAISRETLLLNSTFANVNKLMVGIYGTDKPGWKNQAITLDIPMRDVNGNFSVSGKKWALTKDEVIAAVLNMGNEGNLQRLMDGWGIDEFQCQMMVDSLSEQDVRFVQGVWDLFEGLRPLVKETSELLTGVTPRWVEARPLETKYGILPGGYYPIVTDTRYSQKAAFLEELREHMAAVPLDHLRGATKDGHRRERADAVKGRPPLLSLSVIDRHLVSVIHDACLAPAVRDVNKIIHHVALKDAVKQAFGAEKNRVLNHWVRAVATNNKNNGIVMDAEDRGLGFLQRGVTMMGLGANVSGAMLQTVGYFPLASKIGGVRAVRAMLAGLANPQKTVDFVLGKSAFMREQLNGQDRDVRRMAEKWTIDGGGKLDAFRNATLCQYAFFQNLCNVPGWAESYKLGLKKFNGDDAKAVRYADMIIRTTQGAGTIADLTRFETSGTWKKMFTMFYSWFRVMHNLNVETFRRVKNEEGLTHKVGLFMNHALYVLIANRLIETLLRSEGPDEDETWPQYLVRESLLSVVLSPVEAIPVARDVLGGVSRLSGFGGGYRFSPVADTLSSVSRVIDRAVRAGGDWMDREEPDWGKVFESAVETSGYFLGLPLRQASKWWRLFFDAADSDEEVLEGAMRIIRGMPRKK